MLPLNSNIGLSSGVNFNTYTFPSNILKSDFLTPLTSALVMSLQFSWHESQSSCKSNGFSSKFLVTEIQCTYNTVSFP